MFAIPRILDANANRAREALRVMEEAARFALDDATLSAGLKQLRHDLRAALATLPAGWIEANRNTGGDVGTSISTRTEMSRANLGDVVVAAGKRLSEALRVIEEMSKTIDPEVARQIEALRYRAYEVDQRLLLRMGSGQAKQWRLCLLLTRAACRRPWREVLEGALRGGADCVQVREKDVPDSEFIAHAREVIAMARKRNASVIVNDRADIALAAGADGVHVGQDDMPVHDVRRIAGRTLIVGVSTHDLGEAQRAVEDGADYCGVGAMFESVTKRRAVSGIDYLRAFVERFPHTPHVAIGGITPDNVADVVQAGARGIAVSSAICGADDPFAVTCDLVRACADGAPSTSFLPRAPGAIRIEPRA
jgi:thiamine-phosphate pyrophosphorylase